MCPCIRLPLSAQRGIDRLWSAALLGVGWLWSRPAQAHMGTGLPGGFESGFSHPFHGTDHLLAMMTVGLWGAILGRPLVYVLPIVFPAMMVFGAILGMYGVPLPPIEVGISLSVLILGCCVAFSIKAPVWAASLVIAVFAIFHGYSHGRELPSAADPITYSAGFVLATGLLHVAGIGIGAFGARPRGELVVRGLGFAVALSGAWFLARSIIR